jgi:glutamate-1-semialdehyde 2,1-aminomutase
MIRMTSSGTEATMSALRLARAATGRDVVLKFAGAYHGHVDGLLAEAGSGLATQGIPASPGVPAAAAAQTVVVPWNDLQAVREAFATHELAAVLCEPYPANMGLVPPAHGFLGLLRELCTEHGALLVFDEVMTGWRAHPRGAQVLYGIEPDLTCIGKVVGGGLPAAAYGGRRDLMERIAPAGPVYQAGTLSGNPLAMASGLATLDILARPGTWERAEAFARSVSEAIERRAREAGVAVTVQRVGTMLTPFFSSTPVRDFAAARGTDRAGYNAFFHAMLEGGVYLPPSAFEAAFTSAAHGEAELAAIEAALASTWRR